MTGIKICDFKKENLFMNCPDILLKIVETKKEELCEIRRNAADLKAMALDAVPPLNFMKALSSSGLSVISEIKKASPSAGTISDDFNPVNIAESYLKGGADAVSVLTDRKYFKGDIDYIRDVRDILTIPILRKDFIIDPVQIYEARAYGADTFLLISAILEKGEIEDLTGLGRELGMEPLVESHNIEELQKTVSAGSRIIGINNRNLHNFEVDISLSEKLFPLIPPEALSVAESGIHTAEDAMRMKDAGFSAILVGESLMRSGIENCGEMIQEFKN
jgi:indole-3-glycerol phosphate synthase